jgi:hypothetical protein
MKGGGEGGLRRNKHMGHHMAMSQVCSSYLRARSPRDSASPRTEAGTNQGFPLKMNENYTRDITGDVPNTVELAHLRVRCHAATGL